MPTIKREITVQKPLEAVWAFMSDFRHTEEWDPPTQQTVRESGDGGVGTVYRNRSKFLGREVPITYTVVESDPPHRIRLRGESASMKALDTMTFTSSGTATTLVYEAEFELTGAAKLAQPLMPIGLKRLGDAAEKQIRECLEALPG